MKHLLKAMLPLFLISALASAQPAGREPLYHPDSDPARQLAQNISRAAASGKQVLLKIGGNWCVWCYRFHDFIAGHPELDSIMQADYVVQHVNFSKENENLPFLESLGYPQRFGFPVFVILNVNGDRIHTQNSWYLEDGKESYDPEKVKAFLLDWRQEALDPVRYLPKKKPVAK